MGRRGPSGSLSGPETELAVLAERLKGSIEPHGILSTVVRVVVRALPAQYAAVYLKRLEAEDLVLAAEHKGGTEAGGNRRGRSSVVGRRQDLAATDLQPSQALTFPVLYRSEIVGHLLVFPIDGQQPTAEQRRLLATIAGRAGSAAQVVRQAHDLLQARERLVLAREEERRRLRRNLHDTIGPTLAALSLKVGTLRNLIEQDPPAAQEQLGVLREQIHSVITDIRRVVYDLRPPALDELGIIPAIREQASLFSTGGLQVSVDAPDQMSILPAAVEVAAYRIVVEALANVARHARARHCQIHLSVSDEVRIEVVDDGVGLSATHRPGVGIASMRERVAELGGSCTIESPPEGGTRVIASLPASSQSPGWDAESAAADSALPADDTG